MTKSEFYTSRRTKLDLLLGRTVETEWPIWSTALSKLAKPQDKGIGDVCARVIGHENSLAFKVWFKSTFGKDCGCNGRQELWNKLYPLNR